MSFFDSYGRVIASLVLLVVGVGGFFAMGKPEVPTRPPDRSGPPVVRTVVAENHPGGIQFEVDGVVVPFRQVDIAAQVSGRVEFRADNCRVGRPVKKSELLLRIDQSDYKLEVKRLSEELKQAEAMLAELDVEVTTTENQIELSRQQLEIDVRQVGRNKELLATRAGSESELDAARRAELGTRNALQTLMDQKRLLGQRLNRLQSAKALVQANLDKAELALSRTEIRAPFDGVVVSESVEQDGFVQTGSGVISLQDTSQLDVTCKLHVHQMHWLWQSLDKHAETDADAILPSAYDFPETPATVIFHLGPTAYQWRGVVNRYDGAGIDNQTRMVPCRVHVDRPREVIADGDGSSGQSGDAATNPPTLMTGMFVKVRIDARPPIPLVRLPPESIQPGNAVWTVDEGKLRRKDVMIANSDASFVVAYQQPRGLRAGDAVVVSPVATPIEGLEVAEFGKGGGDRGKPGGPQAGGGNRPGRAAAVAAGGRGR